MTYYSKVYYVFSYIHYLLTHYRVHVYFLQSEIYRRKLSALMAQKKNFPLSILVKI